MLQRDSDSNRTEYINYKVQKENKTFLETLKTTYGKRSAQVVLDQIITKIRENPSKYGLEIQNAKSALKKVVATKHAGGILDATKTRKVAKGATVMAKKASTKKTPKKK